MSSFEQVKTNISHYNNILRIALHDLNMIIKRLQTTSPEKVREIYNTFFNTIEEKLRETDNSINEVKTVQAVLDETFELLYEIKDIITNKQIPFINNSRIGTLEGIARTATGPIIDNTNIDEDNIDEEVQVVLDQPYNERERIDRNTGGKIKNTKKNKKNKRKTNKKKQ